MSVERIGWATGTDHTPPVADFLAVRTRNFGVDRSHAGPRALSCGRRVASQSPARGVSGPGYTAHRLVYRDVSIPCPACTGTLTAEPDALRCKRCSGCFVSTSDFDDILRRTGAEEPIAQIPIDRPDRIRHCPRCRESMGAVELHGIRLDRCETDGVWFDYQELRAVLSRRRRSR
jgi:Zn-finger nucleic acid-binding protein